MPIRPENKARYPADWPAISRRVRDEAGNRCEACGVKNGALIHRGRHDGQPAWRYASDTVFENSRCPETGADLPGTCWDDFEVVRGTVKAVLTVAHLDHTPEHVARENLRAWCQRCHLAYDAPMHRVGRAKRAMAARAAADLFEADT